MGGNAFPDYHTPRMPPQVYRYVKHTFQKTLKGKFEHAGTPIEGPGKSDFGDVDVLVSGIRRNGDPAATVESTASGDTASPDANEENLFRLVGEDNLHGIYEELGAVKWMRHGGNGMTASVSMCVPWPLEEEVQRWAGEEFEERAVSVEDVHGTPSRPEDDEPKTTQDYVDTGSNDTTHSTTLDTSTSTNVDEGCQPRFIQLDLIILRTLASYNWQLFHHAHSDLWNIMSTIIRPLGLTVNENGLNIRIPEVELIDRKKSMIAVTSDPARILNFLGLDTAAQHKPFCSAWELYEFAVTCRFFTVFTETPEPASMEGGDSGSKEKKDFLDLEDDDIQTVEKLKAKLKSNDRKRLRQRPLFQGWIMEFLPWARSKEAYQRPITTRSTVANMVFSAFSADVQTAYHSRLSAWQLAAHRDAVFKTHIKGCIPEGAKDPAWRSALLRELKRCVYEDEVPAGSVAGSEWLALRDEHGWWDTQGVEKWVERFWVELGDAAWERSKVKMREGGRRMEKERTL